MRGDAIEIQFQHNLTCVEATSCELPMQGRGGSNPHNKYQQINVRCVFSGEVLELANAHAQ